MHEAVHRNLHQRRFGGLLQDDVAPVVQAADVKIPSLHLGIQAADIGCDPVILVPRLGYLIVSAGNPVAGTDGAEFIRTGKTADDRLAGETRLHPLHPVLLSARVRRPAQDGFISTFQVFGIRQVPGNHLIAEEEVESSLCAALPPAPDLFDPVPETYIIRKPQQAGPVHPEKEGLHRIPSWMNCHIARSRITAVFCCGSDNRFAFHYTLDHTVRRHCGHRRIGRSPGYPLIRRV